MDFQYLQCRLFVLLCRLLVFIKLIGRISAILNLVQINLKTNQYITTTLCSTELPEDKVSDARNYDSSNTA